MTDSLIAAAALDANITVVATITTELVSNIQRSGDLAPTATAAVGRLATAGVLFGSGLKGAERITLQISGDGPIGALTADAWRLSESTIGARAYARNPHAEIPLNGRGKFDVAGVVGSGFLQVTKSYGVGQPHNGIVPLHSGEIAEDIAAYLVQSEQIPSVVALGVLADRSGVRAAGGVLAQVLPGADESTIAALEESARIMKPVTTLISDGANARDILGALAGGELREHSSLDVSFGCFCTRSKVEIALLAHGSDDLRKLAQERPETVATCEFCKRRYSFTSEQLIALAKFESQSRGGTPAPDPNDVSREA